MNTEETIRIYYWPDGDWCYSGELYGMSYKSDDFLCATVSDNCDEDFIDNFIASLTGEH